MDDHGFDDSRIKVHSQCPHLQPPHTHNPPPPSSLASAILISLCLYNTMDKHMSAHIHVHNP